MAATIVMCRECPADQKWPAMDVTGLCLEHWWKAVKAGKAKASRVR